MKRLIDIDDTKLAFIEKADLTESEIEGIIDEIPTAYDVDKVVEQLMELLHKNKYFDNEYEEGYAIGFENACVAAIRIVKKGGFE